jgi:hypothetical protein
MVIPIFLLPIMSPSFQWLGLLGNDTTSATWKCEVNVCSTANDCAKPILEEQLIQPFYTELRGTLAILVRASANAISEVAQQSGEINTILIGSSSLL